MCSSMAEGGDKEQLQPSDVPLGPHWLGWIGEEMADEDQGGKLEWLQAFGCREKKMNEWESDRESEWSDRESENDEERKTERKGMIVTEWCESWIQGEPDTIVERWVLPNYRDSTETPEGHYRTLRQVSEEAAFVVRWKKDVRDLPQPQFWEIIREMEKNFKKIGVGETSEVSVKLPGVKIRKGLNSWALESVPLTKRGIGPNMA